MLLSMRPREKHQKLQLTFQKGHRLDAIAVGIANEGCVIAFAVLRPQARRAVAAAARGNRCGVKRVDQFARAHAQRRMRTAIGADLRQVRRKLSQNSG